MTALPNQGKLTLPIQWSGSTQKSTMTAAGYELSGTIGWRPWKEMATLNWRLSASDANAMLNAFKATNFNGIYDYTCNVRGAIKLRLQGEFELTEEYGSKLVSVSASVARV